MRTSQTFRIKSINTKSKNNNQQKSLQMSLTCKTLTTKKKYQEQFYRSIIQIQSIQPLQNQTRLTFRQSMVSITESYESADEEFEIWDDNQDLRVKNILLEDKQSSVDQFLQLYKARFGGFPGQRQPIENEEVIKTAISYASSSKKLFKKYFPSRKIIFDDQNDYSQPYKIEDDKHFQKFNRFFRYKKLLPNLRISQFNSKKTRDP